VSSPQWILTEFLQLWKIVPLNFDLINPAIIDFPVFKCLNLLVPNLSEVSTRGEPIRDVIRACAAVPDQGMTKGSPGIFNTVFARKDPLVGEELEWWSSKGMSSSSFTYLFISKSIKTYASPRSRLSLTSRLNTGHSWNPLRTSSGSNHSLPRILNTACTRLRVQPARNTVLRQ
jgi:hypothetical protein